MHARQRPWLGGVAACAAMLLVSFSRASVLVKERPVMKIVRLLQDMKVELQKELDDDKEVHEMLSCWCDSNRKEKTKAIELAQAKSTQLQSTMDEAAAKSVEVRQRRTGTLGEVDSNHEALTASRALRMKESQSFRTEEADLIEAVTACKQAVKALSKHNPELQQLRSIALRLQSPRVAQLMPAASAFLAGPQRDALQRFLQRAVGSEKGASLLAVPGYQSYAPQSGQIFGILKTIQEQFEENLRDLQASEKRAQEEHLELRSAKEAEISAGRKAVTEADGALAELGATHARASEELHDTKEQLEIDQEFLANLEPKCKESAEEYDRRVQSRLEEIAAVEDTIGILNTDGAFDAFDKAVALVQTDLVSDSQVRRSRLLDVLGAASREARAVLGATSSTSGQLAMLETAARLDNFEEVKAAIDRLVTEMARQQQDEVAQYDWCKDGIAKNDRSAAAAQDTKATLESKIADGRKMIDSHNANIAATEASIAEMNGQMGRASETREAENADFQQTVEDQRVMQAILEKALARMKRAYAFNQFQQPGAPHIATSGTHTDPGNGPARYTKYEQNVGGGRVLGMLETVLADSRKTESDAIASEQDSQSAYEALMKDSNAAIKRYSESISNLSASRAKAKAALLMAETDSKQTTAELASLTEMRADLHGSCDFVLQNFEARQSARAAEMDAIREAKSILSGKA